MITAGARRLRLPATAVVALLLVTGAERAVNGAGRGVSFRGGEGRMVSATLTEAALKPAPAVVLVPMLGRTKDDWQGVAQRLADANITALAIDLPGTADPADPKGLAGWSEDVRGAVAFLESRPETRPGAIGVGGASLGATLAAVAAAADLRIRSLVLVSPVLDYRGVRLEGPMRSYGARPALLLASRKDSYSARSVRALADDPPGLREAQWSDQVAHGTLLLSREPDLVRLLVEWFQRTLG